MDAVESRHAGSSDVAAKCQNIARVCAELHMIALDPALQLAMLVRPMEGTERMLPSWLSWTVFNELPGWFAL